MKKLLLGLILTSGILEIRADKESDIRNGLSDFSDATLGFFKSIGRKKCLLRKRITDNFQILHSPLLAT